MDISQIPGYLAGIIFTISAGWYTYDVAKKTVTVSIATFLMFTLINFSQLVALISERVWSVVPFTAVGLVSSALIVLFSLYSGKVYFKLLDKIGLAGALVGFVAWRLSNDAALNIYILSITNLVIFAPLIMKTFKHPYYETRKPWSLNLLASFFLLLTINSSSAAAWAVPVEQFICSVLMNIGIHRAKSK